MSILSNFVFRTDVDIAALASGSSFRGVASVDVAAIFPDLSL